MYYRGTDEQVLLVPSVLLEEWWPDYAGLSIFHTYTDGYLAALRPQMPKPGSACGAQRELTRE